MGYGFNSGAGQYRIDAQLKAREDFDGFTHTALATLRTDADHTKPRLLLLVLFTGLPIFYRVAEAWPPPVFAGLTLLGICLAVAAANTRSA